MRKQQIEAIFTVPWDHFTVAAYFIHVITGVPIFMYVMDDPIGSRRPDEFNRCSTASSCLA